MTEKTITLCGKEVLMRYCAATETGYEQIAGKSAGVFIPKTEKNAEGKDVIIGPPEAMLGDFIKLGMAAIIAAYAHKGPNIKPPVTDSDIIYDATPEDVKLLIKTVSELRNEWYKISEVVEDEKPDKDDGDNEEADDSKNA